LVASIRPGSWDFWGTAIYVEGGFAYKPPIGSGEARPINPAAMAWRRAQRRQAAACMCHSASMTSQPEFWLVSVRPPPPLRFRFVQRGKRIVIGVPRRRAAKDCEVPAQCEKDVVTALSRAQPNHHDRWGIPPEEAEKNRTGA